MKNIKIVFALLILAGMTSCGTTGESNQQDNATHNNDTMVIKQDQTDSATTTVSTDTTKR